MQCSLLTTPNASQQYPTRHGTTTDALPDLESTPSASLSIVLYAGKHVPLRGRSGRVRFHD